MTEEGHVALWHRDCWDLRDVPLPAPDAAPPADALHAPPRRWARIAVGLSAAAVVVLVGGVAADLWPPRAAAAPPVALTAREALVVRGKMPGHDDPPPRTDRFVKPIEASDEVPLLDGTRLDELFPSLKDWIHPVTASAEYMPTFPPRLFGAGRNGIERTECGAGHCGVDLDGPRGRPLVSVAAGTLVRIERREEGADGRSGRYVRIRHDDGTFTSYMHMDDLAEGLEYGGRITQGQYLGTLGATGIHASAPHLHFSLEIPATDARNARGDHVATRYVNPAPFLMRSRIVPVMKRPTRPALN